jgi:AraC-like DNA-binding protein
MTNRIDTSYNPRIHFHELNRICMRINHYIPPAILQGYRMTLPLIYATTLAPYRSHSPAEFLQYPSTYGMYLCVEGTGSMVSPDEWDLQPGSLIICPPDRDFQWVINSSGMLVFYFFFTIDPAVPVMKKLPRAVWPHFIQELAIIADEYRQNIPGWSERASIRCSIMLSRVCTLLGTLKPATPSPYLTQFLISDVDSYLLSNLAMPVMVSEVAEYLGISQRTLMRHYQQRSGKTVYTRMLELRMEKACSLLNSTLLPLIDVAAQVGFSSVNYFGKAFHRHIGINPGEYRKNAFRE